MKKRTFSTSLIIGALALSLLNMSAAHAGGYKRFYEVTITNITKGQTFTPQLLATHTRNVSLFSVGEEASESLGIMAEGGDTAPLTEDLQSLGYNVGDVQTIGGLLGPGQTASMQLEAAPYQRQLSVAAMLIPTNDTFAALNGGSLPFRGSRTFYLQAFDAGTEENDQLCINIPGPRCGGEGVSEEPMSGDEGFIHISNGFHDLGEADEEGNERLTPFAYDWRNPVAKVVVTRVY